MHQRSHFLVSNKHVMLNSTKSEGSLILFSKFSFPAEITFDATKLSVSSKLKILGVTLVPSFYFTHFASQFIQASNLHLHAIKQVRKFLFSSTAVALTISSVLSRLDYRNSLFFGLLNCFISKLQYFQNCAAKTVLQTDYYSSSRACLDCLHWLPVSQRAQFKLLWLTAIILYFNQPAYIYELFTIRQTHGSLRSLKSALWLYQSVSPNSFSHRSFSHIAPILWNFFPFNQRFSLSLKQFRKRLKTHLYSSIPLP